MNYFNEQKGKKLNKKINKKNRGIYQKRRIRPFIFND